MRIIKSYEDNKVMWMNENVEIEFLHRVDRECDENYNYEKWSFYGWSIQNIGNGNSVNDYQEIELLTRMDG